MCKECVNATVIKLNIAKAKDMESGAVCGKTESFHVESARKRLALILFEAQLAVRLYIRHVAALEDVFKMELAFNVDGVYMEVLES